MVIIKILSSKLYKKDAEVNVYLVDDREIERINAKYRGRKYPTDVIAFDLSCRYRNRSIFLADIIVSTDRAVSNASLYKTSPLYEMYMYIAHGLLHILGYKDHTENQRCIMYRKTIHILRSLDIKAS
ncbi:MAG: rRNA maturation RNase YbeY [Candidatus Omnitrophica bacterium]|nr:rRNA maturation RNase YbeY [Candidatus Omnitrophota bacterium]